MAGILLETLHFAKAIVPVADAFAGADVRSDVYSMRDYESVLFIIATGAGATGSSTVLVNSCDDVTPTTRTAMPYYSREVLTTDVQSAVTKRAAAGFVTTVGADRIVIIEVRAEDLVAGDGFVELEMDESVDSPVLGGVIAMFGQGRYKEDVTPTVLA